MGEKKSVGVFFCQEIGRKYIIANYCERLPAMMLFAKVLERWQLGAYVKIGYFETDADLMYQDEVHGSLIEIVDKIVELVYLKYMRAKISYAGIQRRERYFVPEAALRETLLNALCHSQYNCGV